MRTIFLLSLLFTACTVGDNEAAPELDAGVDAPLETFCPELAHETVHADDVGEVKLGARVITPSISYTCDGETTWSYWARRRRDDGRLGSYGRFRSGSTECAWFDAIAERTPALGTCDASGAR